MSEHIDQLIKALTEINDSIDEVMSDAVIVTAGDAKALAERTIIEEGFGAKYSNKEFPAVFFYGRELNAKGRSYLDATLEDPEGDGMTNWKQFRQAQGRQGEHVDLNYSTKMWQGLRPSTDVEIKGNLYFTRLVHNNKEGQNKLNWNFERYGDFIGKALEGKEELLSEVAEEVIRKRLDQLLK